MRQNVKKSNTNVRKFAGVLLKQGEYYLLQHRDDIPTIVAPGTYAIWAGKGEDDESFGQTAIRELYEETGVVAGSSDLQELFILRKPAEENPHFDYPYEFAVYLVEIEESIKVECYEGQGIKKTKNLSGLPKAKLSGPLEDVIEHFNAA